MKVSTINYTVDAGPLVALLDTSDMHHKWAINVFSALGETLGTTEVAIAEAAHLLKKYRPALFKLVELVECGAVKVIPSLVTQAPRIGEMLKKYSQMDMGDATLVALSEEFPRAKLITIDRRDFTVYRRKDGTPVPSIMPPV